MKGLHAIIAILSGFFIYILAHSAYIEPYVRMLHFFQALIYVAIILLLLKYPKTGYFAGIAIAAFWLLVAARGTTFVANGFREWGRFLSSGRIARPVIFMAAPAAVDQALLILMCVYAYIRLKHHSWSDIVLFLATGLTTIGYFIAIVAAFNPQYLAAFRRILTG